MVSKGGRFNTMGDRLEPVGRPADPLRAISPSEPLLRTGTGESRSIAGDRAGTNQRLLRKVIELLAGRWALGVLAELTHGGLRYQDLHDALDGISYKVLTETLRRAERDGLIRPHLDPGSNRPETVTRARRQGQPRLFCTVASLSKVMPGGSTAVDLPMFVVHVVQKLVVHVPRKTHKLLTTTVSNGQLR